MARASLVLALCASGAGCDPGESAGELDDAESADSPRIARISGRKSGSLGYRMNTNHAGGHFFSELNLTGLDHEGTRLLSIEYDEPCGWSYCPPPTQVDPSSITVVGGAMVAQLVDGRTIAHTDFSQTRWTIETTSSWWPMIYELTIEAGSDPATGMPTYNFYWDDGWGEGAQSTCLLPTEAPEMTAVVYRDLNVDENTGEMFEQGDLLSIGCTAGAWGKAAAWGYRYDDLVAVHGPMGLPIFQGLVRVIRADYCGDGQSWTFPGTPIEIGDKLGINNVGSSIGLPGQSLPVDEAAWDLDGAICLDTPRAASVQPIVVSCQNGTIVWPCFWGAAASFAQPSAWFLTRSP